MIKHFFIITNIVDINKVILHAFTTITINETIIALSYTQYKNLNNHHFIYNDTNSPTTFTNQLSILMPPFCLIARTLLQYLLRSF